MPQPLASAIKRSAGRQLHRGLDSRLRLLRARDKGLMLEEGRVGEREEAIGRGAFDDGARNRVDRVEHERGQLVRNAAGVDEIALQLFVRSPARILRTVAAGESAIFFQFDRRIGIAHHHAVAIDAHDLRPALAGGAATLAITSCSLAGSVLLSPQAARASAPIEVSRAVRSGGS